MSALPRPFICGWFLGHDGGLPSAVVSDARPDGVVVGYAAEDLSRFLRATELRIVQLREAIAAAHAKQLGDAPDAESVRRRVAQAWMSAQQEADAIRMRAEADARELIDLARRVVGEPPMMAAGRTPLDRLASQAERAVPDSAP